MAISSSMVWEVQGAGGSDSNGGGFAAGSTGTDYSQQGAAQVAVTDAVANGSTTITSATANFTAAHIGNVIYLAGGSGSLAGTRRQILSLTSPTAIVVDSAVASGTGLTLNLGGCLASLNALAGAMVASNKAFIKAGSYSITTAPVTLAQNAGTPSNAIPPTRLIGYTATRGDITLANAAAMGRPTLTFNATANQPILSFTGSGWEVSGLSFVKGSTNFGSAISATGTDVTVWGCKSVGGGGGSTPILYFQNVNNLVLGCDISGGLGGCTAAIQANGNGNVVRGNWIHDGAGHGVYVNGDCYQNVISNMTGSGVNNGNGYVRAVGNTIYKCAGGGILSTAPRYGSVTIFGNILSENGGYGINFQGAGLAAGPLWDGNAFYNNASGPRSGVNDGTATTVNAQDGVAPYANPYDVSLSADPFVAKGSNDFRLNSTPGGGAACRGSAPAFNGVGGYVSYQDMGSLQHQDTGAILSGGVSKSRLIGGV